MSEKRAYIASIEIEIAVVAESEDEARELAARAWNNEANPSEDEFVIGEMNHVPAGWDIECIVYHNGDEDISVADAAKLPGGFKFKKD